MTVGFAEDLDPRQQDTNTQASSTSKKHSDREQNKFFFQFNIISLSIINHDLSVHRYKHGDYVGYGMEMIQSILSAVVFVLPQRRWQQSP